MVSLNVKQICCLRFKRRVIKLMNHMDLIDNLHDFDSLEDKIYEDLNSFFTSHYNRIMKQRGLDTPHER